MSNYVYFAPILAVDFDGTLCVHKYPDIGEPKQDVIEKVKALKKEGWEIILWTCREGEELKAAEKWCAEQGLEFDAVNKNIKRIEEQFGGDCRKIFANVYLDDRAMNVEDF